MTSTDYLLPGLPLGGSEITIVRWLKAPGQPVSAGEPLLVVLNDSVEVALPATYAGTLDRTLAAEGAPLAVGAPLATIVPSSAADPLESPNAAGSSARAIDPPAERVPSDHEAAARVVRISPLARHIANIAEIDITKLRGSGVSGRIMKADLLALLASRTPKTEYEPAPPPPYHSGADTYVLTAIDVDMERVLEAVARRGPGYTRRRLELSYVAYVALAAVAALSCHQLLNSSWCDDKIVARRRVHLAAVPRDSSAARFIRDAQDLNLLGLARRLSGPQPAAISTSDDSTFTIADLGEHDWGDPAALAGGRSAALGIGAVRARPLVLDDRGIDRLAVRRVALLTLAFDARALDQCQADAFLRDLKRRLERLDP